MFPEPGENILRSCTFIQVGNEHLTLSKPAKCLHKNSLFWSYALQCVAVLSQSTSSSIAVHSTLWSSVMSWSRPKTHTKTPHHVAIVQTCLGMCSSWNKLMYIETGQRPVLLKPPTNTSGLMSFSVSCRGSREWCHKNSYGEGREKILLNKCSSKQGGKVSSLPFCPLTEAQIALHCTSAQHSNWFNHFTLMADSSGNHCCKVVCKAPKRGILPHLPWKKNNIKCFACF